MYLKKLEIFGFKSFGEKTALNFEPGITAIVGPNGCGKSNIFDALRWVLGEQSVKELRGGAMEDVIFNGTDTRTGLGFAEVSLTFSNESRMLATDYDEVMVTRRLFRSGESEYLLNKTVVRLKDILELFMGTGIGAEAYSLVQQGKVDLIVSARPEDRRIIIDEASGITKYKSKKREALNKLQDTENNLLRVNDIVLEVKRQIASLERQASKARRYKDEFEKLKNSEVRLAKFQVEKIKGASQEIQQLCENLEAQEISLSKEMESLNGLLAQENQATEEINQKINDVHSQDLKLENKIEMNNKQINFNDERIGHLTVANERLCDQKNQLIGRCALQREKIASLKNALAALCSAVESNTRLLGEKRQNLLVIAEEIKNAKDSIKSHEERILDLTTTQVKIKNNLTETMKEFQGFLARKRRLELENEKVTLEKGDVDSKLQGILADIDRCLKDIGEFQRQSDEKANVISQLKARLSEKEKIIDELEKRKLFLKSQKQFIEELRVQYHDIADPVIEGTLLVATPLEKNKGIIGKVKEVHQVSLERLNEIKAKFPQFRANELYEIICETKFIELDPEKITAKIDELSREIDLALDEKNKISSEAAQEEAAGVEIHRLRHDSEKTLSSYEAQKNNILSESQKLIGELEIVSTELHEAKNAMAAIKTNEDELTKNLETVDQEIYALQSGIKEQQAQIAHKSQEREETTVAVAQLETEIELTRDNEKSQQENLRMFETEVVRDEAEIKTIEQESLINENKKEDIKREIGTLQEDIAQLKTQRESFIASMSEYEGQKAEVSARIAKVQSDLGLVQGQIEDVRGRVHTQKMKFQEISFDEKSTKDRLLQTYKLNLDEMTLESQEAVNLEELTSEIELLKKRCDSFGSVNLVAIEEFDELKQRFEFLTKQQSDLLTAKDSLEQTISKINRTTRQLFLDTFTKVSEEFRIYFRMLFGGGEAQLILVDPDNALESGIEIVARPPGKKLQSITLLSGGEKTLAAIALIFGVFKVRPSPFCILDEIDAALDESNVGRFSYLLKDFAKIAQFIVITHNKKTIANADVMYGITMQETGISKIVSVKFGEKQDKETKEEIPAAV